MARFFITTTAVATRWDPYALSNLDRMMRAAQSSASARHSVAATPDEADCVLFIGSSCKFHWDVLRSPLFRQHRLKSILFDFYDNAIPRIPGLYMQIPQHLRHAGVYETGFYLRVFDNFVLQEDAPFSECEYLFSFLGKADNWPAVRRPVMQLKHPRAYLNDLWSGQSDGDRQYASIMARSKFVLCPRGMGPSTWRLFETMRSGRVPVIISDEWVELKGMHWNEFSVRVPEKDIAAIPALLESLEGRAEAMGRAARQAWQNHLSVTGAFEWVADACMRMLAQAPNHQPVIRRNIVSESLQPKHRHLFYRELIGETARRLGLKRHTR